MTAEALSCAELQSHFSTALRSRDPNARPDFLSDSAADRFRVYRNNVLHGLSETLGDAYPVVKRLVGDAFFQAMAIEYVVRNLPRERSLTLYGGTFPGFVSGFHPAASVPYLPDVARLERAVLESRHAEDASPIAPDIVAGLGSRIIGVSFGVHPAARMITSPYPIAEIWHANQQETVNETSGALHMNDGSALVTRPRFEVHVRSLTKAETAFVKALFDGQDVAAAFAAGAHIDHSFDLAGTFRILLTAGAFRHIKTLEPGRTHAG